MVDESLGAMNMPTRSELRTLQDRVQETRRENKHLRHELEAVKRRIANLPGGDALPRIAPAVKPSAAPPAAPAAKKTVARKKAVVKPAST